MARRSSRWSAPRDRGEAADQLKERIYVSFTALAILVATGAHGEVDALAALITLLLTVVGTLLAIFVADLVSHVAIHERLMSADELRRALRVSFGAIGAVTLPIVFLAISATGRWGAASALRTSTITLVVTLVVIGWVAIRRTRLTWWRRLIALGAAGLLGLAVIAIELLAHR
ncbi:hypothetical protein [Homoserinibacter sp. YIM 151385]|uniref:hypothetical protein n=1 Tax=Homoserinibacter sp. YIM 151385 TaxID=2985506 RepID=UPI0022F11394|nr:hypothetical protein [Homoserinibacter sp. YIM 151385]WBU37231.1 hypothetical protein OF852_09910 [Homoserinibacter sp. YIM 151385]